MRQKATGGKIRVKSQHGLDRAAHTQIGDKTGAARQNAQIRGGNVGVRAEHRRHAPVEMMGERALFAGCLGVKIAQGKIVFARHVGQDLFHRLKRRRQGFHEQRSEQIDDQNAVRGDGKDVEPAPGAGAGKIARTEHARRSVQFFPILPMAEHVVARGDQIHAGGKQQFRADAMDAVGIGAVFAVGDHKIRRQFPLQGGQDAPQIQARALSHNVSQTKKTNRFGFHLILRIPPRGSRG